jgi:hypothetical protein
MVSVAKIICSVNVWVNEYGTLVEWYGWGKTKGLVEKSVPLPLCASQIPHDLACDQTFSSAVTSWQLTTQAMAQPLKVYYHIH